MDRRIIRLAAAVLCGLAIVTALAALVIAASAGGRAVPVGVETAIPLIAGGAVALLSWFLLAGATHNDDLEARRTRVRCPACGTEVRRDWRLCPYCGAASRTASRDDASPLSHLN